MHVSLKSIHESATTNMNRGRRNRKSIGKQGSLIIDCVISLKFIEDTDSAVIRSEVPITVLFSCK